MHRIAENLPVFAVCGFKNSGKTTLIEKLVPILRDDGLTVAIVKSDAHGLRIDHEGTDSDRIFRSGADVLVRGPNESLSRSRSASDPGLGGIVERLLENHDTVLVEGHKATSLPKIWLHKKGETEAPSHVDEIEIELPWDAERVKTAANWLRDRIATLWRSREIRGAVLIGGQSRRMGRPKQTLNYRGKELVTWVINAISGVVEDVVFAGLGPVPEAHTDLIQIPDPPRVPGPLAGVLAAMRWAPNSSWIVAACDMPEITSGAVDWLVDQRRPGCWAVLPTAASGTPEPLFAVYEPQIRWLLESQVATGLWELRRLTESAQVACPSIPPEHQGSWANINTPEDL